LINNAPDLAKPKALPGPKSHTVQKRRPWQPCRKV
jgi:hypothetical protein